MLELVWKVRYSCSVFASWNSSKCFILLADCTDEWFITMMCACECARACKVNHTQLKACSGSDSENLQDEAKTCELQLRELQIVNKVFSMKGIQCCGESQHLPRRQFGRHHIWTEVEVAALQSVPPPPPSPPPALPRMFQETVCHPCPSISFLKPVQLLVLWMETTSFLLAYTFSFRTTFIKAGSLHTSICFSFSRLSGPNLQEILVNSPNLKHLLHFIHIKTKQILTI